jgi:hypothetical protein
VVIDSFVVIEVKETAGSGASEVSKPALQGRIEELRAYESLSKTTDDFF